MLTNTDKLPTKQQNGHNSDSAIVKQVERDLEKAWEEILQERINREQMELPTDAEEEQFRNQEEFEEAIGDIKKLGKAMWRFG